jgi:hypothetical protein
VKRRAALALLALAAPAGADVEVVPRVGADFEHFGETYRITADRDTVTAVDDYGSFAGLLLRSPGRPATGFELDVEGYAGRSTRRARARFEGRWTRASDRLEVHQEASYRVFPDSGDYTVTGDHLEERFSASWRRRLSGPWHLRLRHSFDGTWYDEPDEYNLTSWTHEPRADLDLDFGEWSRLRVGYRFGKRDVPDSTTLGYRRHGAQAELSWGAGETTNLDVAHAVERREYDAASVRESYWEHRLEARLELAAGDQATCRLVHESEILRFDEPDDLDFDSNWIRTGVQLELHRSRGLDLSLMPVHALLGSDTAPNEVYSEIGLELGVDWRLARHGWISVTNEIGRRDYEVNAAEEAPSLDLLSAAAGASLDTASSDYTYDRLTLVLGLAPWRGVSVDLFVHWQPESHEVSAHDSDTKIVSGGVSYAF